MSFFGSHRDSSEKLDRDQLQIREFFEESDKLHGSQRWLYPTTIILAIICIAWYGYATVEETHPIPFARAFSPEHTRALRDIINFVATALIAVWASIFVVKFLNKGNLLRIETIKGLARHDVLEFVFYMLRRYEKKHVENKSVVVVFDKAMRSDRGLLIAKATQTVTMRLKPNRPFVILEFDRLGRAQGGKLHTSDVDLLNRSSPDDLWSIDTTDVDAGFPGHDDLFPGLTKVVIDSVPQKLRATESGARSRWVFPIDDAYLHNRMVDVQYVYEYAQEIPGFCFIEIFEPTRGFTCSLDFRKIVDDMSCYAYDTTNPTRYQHNVEKADDGIITVFNKGWVLPRATVAFCWYERKGKKGQHLTATEQQDGKALPAPSDIPVSDDAHEFVVTEDLKVDGHCLGVAIRDAWRLSALAPSGLDLSKVSTVKDAYRALKTIRRPSLIIRREAGFSEGLILRAQAMRLGFHLRQSTEFQIGDVLLCLRSMRQLYGIERADAHWVALRITRDGSEIFDRLWSQIVIMYPEARRSSGDAILQQIGPTILV